MIESVTVLRIAVYTPLARLLNQGVLGKVPGDACFDYLPSPQCSLDALMPGMRVQVPFGQKERIGIFVELSDTPQVDKNKLRQIVRVIDDKPILPIALFKMVQWVSRYYHCSLTEVFHLALPKSLREVKSSCVSDNILIKDACLEKEGKPIKSSHLILNSAQDAAVKAIRKASTFETFLLNGVTGSGKTEVYLQVIADQLSAGKQALVLVPEIALTPQTLRRFEARFVSHMVVMHSALTQSQRLQAWLKAQQGLASVVIGTRSAIFTPFKRLGIIILDEEHDSSFKQQSRLRYSARDLAVVRGKFAQVPVVLGSATPSLESLYNVQCGRYHYLSLPERAGGAVLPNIRIVNLCDKKLKNGLSPVLLKAIEKRLDKNEQVLLFLNRRGFSPILMCHKCGWCAVCSECDARLIVYKEPSQLKCHQCDKIYPVCTLCPCCKSSALMKLGVGTQRLASELRKQFPQANLVRIDGDAVRGRGKIQALLDKIHCGESQLIIGTQILSKGHHFPDVTLVAIIDADQGLLSADFRATEQMGQLLSQVAGRAGRADKPGEVIIQTHYPHHPMLKLLFDAGYLAFADQLLSERKQADLPPYYCMATLRAEAKDLQKTYRFLKSLRLEAEDFLLNLSHFREMIIKIHGPIPLIIQRKANYYRLQLLFQAPSRKTLQIFLSHLMKHIRLREIPTGVRWLLDVDPIETF